ncbi:MAG: ATP phosphoribosyltransferase [Gammaproteobacteria bacterium]|nr:ATP phosphoribosyltransferase [Gammaproteobacteria bacterium]
MTKDPVKIAVQKSGRLTPRSLELLDRIGLDYDRSPDQLLCVGRNMPVEALLVRDDDIPELVRDGTCTMGFVGLNVARETEYQRRANGQECGFEVVQELGFGQCRLAIARQETDQWNGPQSLQGKRIATSYPHITQHYLDQHNIDAQVIAFAGSVEIAPALGKSDFVCDLVSTGATLAANKLIEEDVILESHSVVIRTTRSTSAQQDYWMDKLTQRIDGVIRVQHSKYIMLHAPIKALAAVTRLLPGSEAPTVIPLQGCNEKVAVHAVCRENVFWETLEDLKAAGATAMLVLPVEKMLA